MLNNLKFAWQMPSTNPYQYYREIAEGAAEYYAGLGDDKIRVRFPHIKFRVLEEFEVCSHEDEPCVLDLVKYVTHDNNTVYSVFHHEQGGGGYLDPDYPMTFDYNKAKAIFDKWKADIVASGRTEYEPDEYNDFGYFDYETSPPPKFNANDAKEFDIELPYEGFNISGPDELLKIGSLKFSWTIPFVDSKTTDKGVKKYYDEDGKLHNDVGPARIYWNGSKHWYQHGVRYRPDGGPSVERSDGTNIWTDETGRRHRGDDLPAVEYGDGGKAWWVNGLRHRDGDKPARLFADGSQHWYQQGDRHRENGPAIITSNGEEHYYLNDKYYSKEEYDQAMGITSSLKLSWAQPYVTREITEDRAFEYFDENHKLHREDGPAIEATNGDQAWYQHGKLHREDGPAVIKNNGRYFAWYQNSKRHRLDGPAVIYPDGTSHWFVDGKRHRTDGPAVMLANGENKYFVDGKHLYKRQFERLMNNTALAWDMTPTKKEEDEDKNIVYYDDQKRFHRDDGPAFIEGETGTKYWYQHDKLHRVGGPAIEYTDGHGRWFEYGTETAIEYPDGTKKIHSDEGHIPTSSLKLSWREVQHHNVKPGDTVVDYHGNKHTVEFVTEDPEEARDADFTGAMSEYFDQTGESATHVSQDAYKPLFVVVEGDDPDIPTIVFVYGEEGVLKVESNQKQSWVTIDEIDPGRDDQVWLDNQGRYHREGGPAVIWDDGTESWYQHGLLHRKGGPAEVYPSGNKSWYQFGLLHREDGPAIEKADGFKAWYLDGQPYTEEAYMKEMEDRKRTESSLKLSWRSPGLQGAMTEYNVIELITRFYGQGYFINRSDEEISKLLDDEMTYKIQELLQSEFTKGGSDLSVEDVLYQGSDVDDNAGVDWDTTANYIIFVAGNDDFESVIRRLPPTFILPKEGEFHNIDI